MQMLASVLGAVVLFALLPAGESIICYQCRSWEDEGCLELRQNMTLNETKYARYCDDDRIPAGAGVFCRTIHQKIRDGNGTDRLWRTCGWEEYKTKTGERHPKACYYVSDGHHEEEVCQCFFDTCNSATARGVSALAALTAVLAALAALRTAS